jgi:hypothetical protein
VRGPPVWAEGTVAVRVHRIEGGVRRRRTEPRAHARDEAVRAALRALAS